jgi:hypothetical protein
MKPLTVAALIIAAFAAVVLAAHFGVWGFYVNREIKPIDVAILAVNLFIALFLSQYIADRAGNLRAEKDLMMSDIRDVLNELKASRELLIACQESQKINKLDKKAIIAVIRRVANGINLVESALRLSQCSRLVRTYDDITDAYVRYKRSATGGTFPTPFTQDQISDQEREYRKLVERLHSLLFAINRYSFG